MSKEGSQTKGVLGKFKKALIVIVVLLVLNNLYWKIRDATIKNDFQPVIEKLNGQKESFLLDVEKYKDCFEAKELASYTPIAEKCYTGIKEIKKLMEGYDVEIEELYSKVENELPEYDKDKRLLHDLIKIQKSDEGKKYYMAELEFLQAYIDLFEFIKYTAGTRETWDELSVTELSQAKLIVNRIEGALKKMESAEATFIAYLESNYSAKVINLVKEKGLNIKNE